MELRITCEGSDVIDYKEIKNLQGSLKTRTMDDIEEMIKSLIQYGFSFPMFVYKHKKDNYAVDGHGRLLAFSLMEENGYRLNEEGELVNDGEPWIIPPIPCVFIEADNFTEAKVKLLKLNSEYGTITEEGFKDFTKDIDLKEYEGIPLRILDTNTLQEIETSIDIPVDIDFRSIPIDEYGDEGDEPATGFEPSLEPEIKTITITKKEIEAAVEKELKKKGSDTETMTVHCKHCGKEMVVRKSDVVHLINDTIKGKKYGN